MKTDPHSLKHINTNKNLNKQNKHITKIYIQWETKKLKGRDAGKILVHRKKKIIVKTKEKRYNIAINTHRFEQICNRLIFRHIVLDINSSKKWIDTTSILEPARAKPAILHKNEAQKGENGHIANSSGYRVTSLKLRDAAD